MRLHFSIPLKVKMPKNVSYFLKDDASLFLQSSFLLAPVLPLHLLFQFPAMDTTVLLHSLSFCFSLVQPCRRELTDRLISYIINLWSPTSAGPGPPCSSIPVSLIFFPFQISAIKTFTISLKSSKPHSSFSVNNQVSKFAKVLTESVVIPLASSLNSKHNFLFHSHLKMRFL